MRAPAGSDRKKKKKGGREMLGRRLDVGLRG
jgi:hypothetical protein